MDRHVVQCWIKFPCKWECSCSIDSRLWLQISVYGARFEYPLKLVELFSLSMTLMEYSASLQYCPALGTFVLSVSGGGETRPYSLDLLEAETKIPAIKSSWTNNSSKHDLAFLEQRRSPGDCIQGLADHGGVTHLATDDCIKTNREHIRAAVSRTSRSNG